MVLLTNDALAEHRRRQRENGFTFPLVATSLGLEETLEARVRGLELFDKAAIKQLPVDVQAAVWEAIQVSQREQKLMAEFKGSPETFDAFSERGRHLIEVANVFVIAAFVEPRVVATEAELAEQPGAWWIENIHTDDRIEFMQLSNSTDAGVSKKLKMFRPGPAPDVADEPALPVATEPAPDMGDVRNNVQPG